MKCEQVWDETVRPVTGYAATIGVFDGVHRGHRYLLQCLAQEAVLMRLHTMAITFDTVPCNVIHPAHPLLQLTTPAMKEHLLRSSGMEEVVMLHFDGNLRQMTAYEFMDKILKQQLNVKLLLLGHDHVFGCDRPSDHDVYVRYGCELGINVLQASALSDGDQRISSSQIRILLEQGNIEDAIKLLGHPYTLEGVVVHGYKLGRTIGFPTANISFSPSLLLPQVGVYAVYLHIGGIRYAAMLNIGSRPTVGGKQQTVEAHIFGFSGEIYGCQVMLEFVSRLRNEIAFSSLSELQQQLIRDKIQVQRLLGVAQ